MDLCGTSKIINFSPILNFGQSLVSFRARSGGINNQIIILSVTIQPSPPALAQANNTIIYSKQKYMKYT